MASERLKINEIQRDSLYPGPQNFVERQPVILSGDSLGCAREDSTSECMSTLPRLGRLKEDTAAVYERLPTSEK